MADTEEFLDRLGELTTDLMMVDDPAAEELDRVASGLEDMRQQFTVLRSLEEDPQAVDEILASIEAAETRLETLRDNPDEFEESLARLGEELTELEGLIRSYSEDLGSGDSGTSDSETDESSTDTAKTAERTSNGSGEAASFQTDPADYDEELFYDFFTEANEHLVEFEDVLLTLEQGRDPEALNRGFRGMHSIKGAAGFLNLNLVNQLSHAMEDLLGLYRDEGYRIEEEPVELLFESMDALKNLINLHHATVEQTEQKQINPDKYKQLQSRLRATIETMQETGERVESPDLDPPEEPDEDSVDEVETQSIRVNTEKIDTLVNRAGELVTTFHQLDQMRQDNGDGSTREKRQMYNQMDRIVGDIQEEALSLRMVPLKGAFNKTRRLVRDLSKQFGKEVELTIRGEETELDRSLVEKVQDPLVHLVRNAMDHGIEDPDVREEADKPRQGQLEIAAYHESGDVVVEISDDGSGIDPEAVFEKAVDKGLVDAGAPLSDSEIYQLLFEPGFSTTEEVTDVSGRGVGMDVVRKNIEAIRGTIDVESELGEGTTFRLNIPLTLSIINGMIMKLGDRRFVLPTTNIVRSLKPEEHQMTTVEGQGEVLNVHDELIGLCRLNRLFDTDLQDRDVTESLVVIVKGGSRKVALQVDDLLGQQEVVIKSLGKAFEQLRGISGAAILGDGEVGLIIDTQTLDDMAASIT